MERLFQAAPEVSFLSQFGILQRFFRRTTVKQSAQFAQTAFGQYIEYFCFLLCLLDRGRVSPHGFMGTQNKIHSVSIRYFTAIIIFLRLSCQIRQACCLRRCPLRFGRKFVLNRSEAIFQAKQHRQQRKFCLHLHLL